MKNFSELTVRDGKVRKHIVKSELDDKLIALVKPLINNWVMGYMNTQLNIDVILSFTVKSTASGLNLKVITKSVAPLEDRVL